MRRCDCNLSLKLLKFVVNIVRKVIHRNLYIISSGVLTILIIFVRRSVISLKAAYCLTLNQSEHSSNSISQEPMSFTRLRTGIALCDIG